MTAETKPLLWRLLPSIYMAILYVYKSYLAQ